MKKWIFGFLFLATISVAAFRKPLLAHAIQFYFVSHGVDIELAVSKFSFSELELQHIIIDKKNKIAQLKLLLSPQKKFFLKNLEMQISTIDMESLSKIGQKFGSKKSSSDNDFSFEQIQSYCQNLTQSALNINLQDVVMGDNLLNVNLHAVATENKLSIQWQDLPKTHGSLLIQCSNNGIFLEAPHLALDLKETRAFNMSIQDFSINLSGSQLKWTPQSPINFSAPGMISTHIVLNKKNYKVSIPQFHFTAQNTSQDLKSIEASFKAKNIEIDADSIFKADLQLSSDLTMTQKNYKLKVTLRDKTKQIFIDDLKISSEPEKKIYSLFFDKAKTQFRLNSRVLELLPPLKDYLKTLSGKINIGGELQWADGALGGFVDIVGSHLSSSTEFGDFEDINIQHRIQSFQNFSSPPKQKLNIKKIKIGPGIENINVVYKIESRNSVLIHKFSANLEDGLIYTDAFSIDIQQKQTKNFLAQIVDFDLEKVLSFGLKDSVRANGKLHGHIGVSYIEAKPILRGLLVSPKNGWIQYRPGDRKQATSLSLSDGPMDILNNYLYDFQYEQLSLRIDTDKNFDMKMTLNTFGHNPNYLNGKLLKLNINLEQNLLAAMRSLMLTYDLPTKIKEKFEKVEP
ncbi:YdbH domain-containing protein [bacterium]|nr:YdbH domain-containing protein [bacterium]